MCRSQRGTNERTHDHNVRGNIIFHQSNEKKICDPLYTRQSVNMTSTRCHRQTEVHVVVVVSHIQRSGCQPEKATLHGGQSRSWSAEQGKENKRKSLAAYPPPPKENPARSEKKKKNHATHLQALRRSRSVSRTYKDTFGSSTRH